MLAQLADPRLREREQLVEVGAGERRALARRLQLHEAAVAGHHDVRVDLGPRVLAVVEVEQRHAVDHPARDRRDRARQRAALEQPLRAQPRAGERQRDVGAGDRRAAGAAVGLQHVAVEVHGPFAERLEVDDHPQRAPDQALDLDGAPSGRPRVTSRCLRSPVEAGSIPYSAVTQPRPLPGHPARARSPAPRPCRSRASPPPRSAPTRSPCARTPARSCRAAARRGRARSCAVGAWPSFTRAIIPERYGRDIVRALVVSNMLPDAAHPGRGSFVRDQVAALRRPRRRRRRAVRVPARPARAAPARPASCAAASAAGEPLRRRARPLRPDRLAGPRRARPAARPDDARHRPRRSAHAARDARSRCRRIELPAAVSAELLARDPRSAPARRARVLPCGVDTERFRPIDRGPRRAASSGSPTQRPVVLFPADPARPEKRFDRAARARRALGARAARARRRRARARPAVRERRRTPCSSPPSARASGSPCSRRSPATSRCSRRPSGSTPQALEGVAGTLCAPFDPGALARRRSSPHLARAATRACAGRAAAERWSATAMAERVLDAWREALTELPLTGRVVLIRRGADRGHESRTRAPPARSRPPARHRPPQSRSLRARRGPDSARAAARGGARALPAQGARARLPRPRRARLQPAPLRPAQRRARAGQARTLGHIDDELRAIETRARRAPAGHGAARGRDHGLPAVRRDPRPAKTASARTAGCRCPGTPTCRWPGRPAPTPPGGSPPQPGPASGHGTGSHAAISHGARLCRRGVRSRSRAGSRSLPGSVPRPRPPTPRPPRSPATRPAVEPPAGAAADGRHAARGPRAAGRAPRHPLARAPRSPRRRRGAPRAGSAAAPTPTARPRRRLRPQRPEEPTEIIHPQTPSQ